MIFKWMLKRNAKKMTQDTTFTTFKKVTISSIYGKNLSVRKN